MQSRVKHESETAANGIIGQDDTMIETLGTYLMRYDGRRIISATRPADIPQLFRLPQYRYMNTDNIMKDIHQKIIAQNFANMLAIFFLIVAIT